IKEDPSRPGSPQSSKSEPIEATKPEDPTEQKVEDTVTELGHSGSARGIISKKGKVTMTGRSKLITLGDDSCGVISSGGRVKIGDTSQLVTFGITATGVSEDSEEADIEIADDSIVITKGHTNSGDWDALVTSILLRKPA
ncbi:12182_t:CDS:2, partial [Acaulospora colombiana]